MLPEWRDKFLSYKDLKKQLKRIYFSDGSKRQKMSVSDESVVKEVDEFVNLCKDETHKFNDFVLEKQEWYIIRIKFQSVRPEIPGTEPRTEPEPRHATWSGSRFLGHPLFGSQFFRFRFGSMCALNYTGLVKILKKHDKLSGALIRVPFIQQVLNEPFYTTDVLSNLVKKCETMLDQLFSMNVHQPFPCASPNRKEDGSDPKPEDKSSLTVPEDLVDIKNMENTYMRLTLSALTVLKEIRSGMEGGGEIGSDQRVGISGKGVKKEVTRNSETVVANIGLKHPMSGGVDYRVLQPSRVIDRLFPDISATWFPRTTKQLENVIGTSCSHNYCATLLATAIVFIKCATNTLAAKEYQVGGGSGCRLSAANETEFYNVWASRRRFHIGDSQRFRYIESSVTVKKWEFFHGDETQMIMGSFLSYKEITASNTHTFVRSAVVSMSSDVVWRRARRKFGLNQLSILLAESIAAFRESRLDPYAETANGLAVFAEEQRKKVKKEKVDSNRQPILSLLNGDQASYDDPMIVTAIGIIDGRNKYLLWKCLILGIRK
nr:hypothetical protein [Tanacetum cinerariifolium]